MTIAIEAGLRRVATYERVSSEDQRERETIKTQRDALDRRFASEPAVILVDRYVDEAVSGSKSVADRPDGARLLRDAEVGRFNELWVYRLDRLGRDLVDMAIVGRRLRQLGIRLLSLVEGEPDPFMFDIQAALAENEKRIFRQRSADGMDRAAREGRYTGGIIAFGLRVEGTKEAARLVPDESILWADQSAAGLVRWIYERLGIERWSCRRIAHELNARGVPTHYARDGRMVKVRGERKKHTQGVWRPGRIRNLVINPVYRGEIQYGRRTKNQTGGRDVISAPVEALVSPTLWHAAREALAENRAIPKNTRRRYLLRGIIRCGICGLTYVGSRGRGEVGWYRCTGQLAERGPIPGRCWGQSLRTDAIESVVWGDVGRWLRAPGDILDELDGQAEREAQSALAEVQSITLGRALEALENQRKQVLALNIRGRLPDGELDAELDRITAEKAELQRRVAALEPSRSDVPQESTTDLLGEVRGRLDAGLTDDQRQEIVRLLVRIVVYTELPAEGRKKSARAVVEYRFPGVVETRTGKGSLLRRAGTEPERWSRGRRARSPRGLPRGAAAALRARRDRIRGAHRGTGPLDRPA
jgi:site-specific DNA recombinase